MKDVKSEEKFIQTTTIRDYKLFVLATTIILLLFSTAFAGDLFASLSA
jgi:hypothetical protein